MIKSLIARFRKPKPMQIIITIKKNADGTFDSSLKMSKAIPVTHALTMIDRIKAQINAGITNRCYAKGLTHKKPQTRTYINKLTIGDL